MDGKEDRAMRDAACALMGPDRMWSSMKQYGSLNLNVGNVAELESFFDRGGIIFVHVSNAKGFLYMPVQMPEGADEGFMIRRIEIPLRAVGEHEDVLHYAMEHRYDVDDLGRPIMCSVSVPEVSHELCTGPGGTNVRFTIMNATDPKGGWFSYC